MPAECPVPGPHGPGGSPSSPGCGHLCRTQTCPAVPALLFLLSSVHSLKILALSQHGELRLGIVMCACERPVFPAFSVTIVATCCWLLLSAAGALRPSDTGGVPAPSRSGEQRSPCTQVRPSVKSWCQRPLLPEGGLGVGGRGLVLPVLCAQHYTSVWTETRGQWKGRTKANHVSIS